MKEKRETKPDLGAIRIVPEAQIPPLRSKHDELYNHIHALLAKLPKGQAVELNLTKLKVNSESIRHRIHYYEKGGSLPSNLQVQRRATPDGVLLYIRVARKETEQ